MSVSNDELDAFLAKTDPLNKALKAIDKAMADHEEADRRSRRRQFWMAVCIWIAAIFGVGAPFLSFIIYWLFFR